MYNHPQVFPMHGYSGPSGVVVSPANARLTGDSWRYISGGAAILYGQPLDDVQRAYSGYCLLYGLFNEMIVIVQVLFALVALIAVTALGRRLAGNAGGWLAGALFALNPEFAAWHCAIMTESVYTSCVCISAFLALWATEHTRLIRMPIAFMFFVLTAFLRPTGWILLPATLIFWCCMCLKKTWMKATASVLVACAFVIITTTFASGDIGQQSPVMKLYTGEVIWQEELWRVDMPPADMSRMAIADGLLYGLRHPLASGWLMLKRMFVMLLRIRPSYSLLHNLFLLAFHLPITVFGIASFILLRRSAVTWAIAAMFFSHALVVALTFNDNDGRFTLYFTPLLATAAVSVVVFSWVGRNVRLVGDNNEHI
ncbi:MAG: glycosyltransferase family 39 protein [Victivallales bacterium]|nr:glycosyltransferase family 39 protein [Victivallales bacterium]